MFDGLTQGQIERLMFIDFCLVFKGEFARSELMERFGVAQAAATRDLARYRQLLAEQGKPEPVLDHSVKRYRRVSDFVPLCQHNPDYVITQFNRSVMSIDGEWGNQGGALAGYFQGVHSPFEQRSRALLNLSSDILPSITRAIHQQTLVDIRYLSLTRESLKRFAPHTIVSNGHRWHVRGAEIGSDGSAQFKDLVLTRMRSVTGVDQRAPESALMADDLSWQQRVTLRLVPHPVKFEHHHEVIELDYGMTNGCLELQTRLALLDYTLNLWDVDCSQNAVLSGFRYQLYLDNRAELAGFDAMQRTPGFTE
ncbi:WYL domain-containing protein [Ferrimonas aestuarii]|nr:WYL domain-containing protein [Ferrimonas aestuarii]